MQRPHTVAVYVQLGSARRRSGSAHGGRSAATRATGQITVVRCSYEAKGNKVRLCPLWASTTAALKKRVSGRADKERVFLGRSSQSMTRFGVHDIVTRYARIARGHRATLRHKRVGPHKIRHTTATHLPRAGVDINTIRAWPRHVSIDITNIYAESVEMKAKALGMCEAKLPRERRRWRDNPDLLTFLAQL